MSEARPIRHAVRQRLVEELGEFHPEIEIVRVRAWLTEEAGGQRWSADERSQGKGTHDAYLVVVKRPRPRRRDRSADGPAKAN